MQIPFAPMQIRFSVPTESAAARGRAGCAIRCVDAAEIMGRRAAARRVFGRRWALAGDQVSNRTRPMIAARAAGNRFGRGDRRSPPRGYSAGQGGATLVDPMTVQVPLDRIGDSSESGVHLFVSASSGIVASGDGAAWAGVRDLALPFP